MLGGRMATRPSTTLPALGVLVAAGASGLLLVAGPDGAALGVGWLALVPVAALLLVGPVRAAAIAGSLVFVAVLHWAYTAHFSPVYAYAGLIDANPSSSSLLVVTVLTALPALFLPLAADRPSTIVLWALYVAGYVPAATVPIFLEGDLGEVLPFLLALAGSMAILAAMVRVRPPAILLPHLSVIAFTRLLVVLASLCALYIVATFGVHALPTLSSVYDTRAQFAAAQATSTGSGYIVPWAANVIDPMLIALGVARRRVDLVALGLLGQLLIYSNTGYKAVLFSVAMVPAVYLVISLGRRWFGPLAVLGTTLVVAGTVLISAGGAPLALATRLFATSGHVSWRYYEYFSTHAQYHLSHSIFSGVLTSPYTDDPPLLIGKVYFDQGTDANASLWADAFANFGFGGIVVFTMICGVVLLALDAVGQRRDARVAGPAMAIAGLSLGASGVLTTVLTQGLALVVIMVALMPPGLIGRAPKGRTG
jgi:hypothetical protein